MTYLQKNVILNTETPAALIILLLTTTVSLLALYGQPQWIEKGLFRPYYFLRRRQYYTLFTHGLLHSSVSHLLFNMLTFYFFAFTLERTIGTPRFVLLYLLALCLSEVRTYLQQADNPRYATLGASGAVAAILFAEIVYYPYQSLFIMFIPVPIPAPLFAVGYVAYSVYLSRRGDDGVNHNAHIDGAITGLLFVALTDINAYRELIAYLMR